MQSCSDAVFEKFDLPNTFFVLLSCDNDCCTKMVFYVHSIEKYMDRGSFKITLFKECTDKRVQRFLMSLGQCLKLILSRDVF